MQFIINLKDEPEHISLLAKWHHREWSYLNPGKTEAQRAEKMKCYLGDNFVPSTYLLKNGSSIIGSAAVIESDMDTHSELTPWLASVYVHPDYREQGAGSKLVQYVMDQCKRNAIKTFYLFTPGQAKFYERLGWKTLKTEEYRGTLVTIMRSSK